MPMNTMKSASGTEYGTEGTDMREDSTGNSLLRTIRGGFRARCFVSYLMPLETPPKKPYIFTQD